MVESEVIEYSNIKCSFVKGRKFVLFYGNKLNKAILCLSSSASFIWEMEKNLKFLMEAVSSSYFKREQGKQGVAAAGRAGRVLRLRAAGQAGIANTGRASRVLWLLAAGQAGCCGYGQQGRQGVTATSRASRVLRLRAVQAGCCGYGQQGRQGVAATVSRAGRVLSIWVILCVSV